MIVAFIGHRTINKTEALKDKLKKIVENLIIRKISCLFEKFPIIHTIKAPNLPIAKSIFGKFNEKCPLIVSSKMKGTSCGEIAVGELDSDEQIVRF